MSRWRLLLYRLLPKPQALRTVLRQGAPQKPAKAVLVFSYDPNPTFAYYLEERLNALRGVPVIVCSGHDEALDELDPDGLFVIICRYVGSKQLRWLERNIDRLSGISLLLDDDIAGVVVGRDASLKYKIKLMKLAILPLRRLNPLLDIIYASTEPLARTLSAQKSRVVLMPPAPSIEGRSLGCSRPLTMVYHATGIHAPEHRFLVPVVEAAMRRHDYLHFQVFASRKNADLWRRAKIDPKRLLILPELSWAAYLHYCTYIKADIALVPLLPGQANACRSDTKRIDVCRLGAAGIFSETEVFNRNRQPGELHVENKRENWLAAIDELVTSSERRAEAAGATRLSVQQMISRANLQIPGLHPC